MAGDARKVLEKAARDKIEIEYGTALQDEDPHSSGIKIGQGGAALLAEVAGALKDLPSWTVVLEGHCPGRPEHNDVFRESVAEEAADLCKSYLQDIGVANSISCQSQGCLQGRGMCVQLMTVEPDSQTPGIDAPQSEAPRQAASAKPTFGDTQTVEIERQSSMQPSMMERAETEGQPLVLGRVESEVQPGMLERAETDGQPVLFKAESESAGVGDRSGYGQDIAPLPDISRAETMGIPGPVAADDFVGTLKRNMTEHVGGDDFPVPDTSNLSIEEKRKAMDELLDKVLETNIAFEPNKAEIQQRGLKTVRQLARVLAAFDLPVKCVGHSKGRPADNNHAKRQLAQARAEAVKEALRFEGAENEIICASFGSALGRGMCVRINSLTPEEVEDGELLIPDCSDLTKDQQEPSLNQLLQEELEKGLAFEPNKASIQEAGAPVIRRVGNILKAFPGFTIRCEGHAKGQACDNNDAKRRLSQVRAEAVRAAVMALGVTNTIVCIGMGSSQGLGMCVRMFATDPDKEIELPDTAELSKEEKEKLLNSLLEKALERSIEFEPNKSELPPAGNVAIRTLSRVLNAFPEFTLCCESHTKGLASENSEAKCKLSLARAEVVKAAVLAAGVTNTITCRGAGSSQGLGMCLKMFVIDPEELKKDEITVPDKNGMSAQEQATLLDALLEKVLQKNIEFAPNVYEVPATADDTIRAVANVLRQFPDFALRCEGHAKGQPSDNSEAKKKLSYMRAEAVKAGVKQQGVQNGIHCVGQGCAQGRGMRVRMFVIDPEELKKDDVALPDRAGDTTDEIIRTLNGLLSKALERNINFEPNKAEIKATGLDVVAQLSRVLKAFPEFRELPLRCEGHTKGKPHDHNEAKARLSQVRAEAVRMALHKDGVENEIVCIGRGSEQGLGMCVRMFVDESE